MNVIRSADRSLSEGSFTGVWAPYQWLHQENPPPQQPWTAYRSSGMGGASWDSFLQLLLTAYKSSGNSEAYEPSTVMAWSWWAKSCATNYSCCGFKTAMIMSCLKTVFHNRPSAGSYIIFMYLFITHVWVFTWMHVCSWCPQTNKEHQIP